MPPHCWTIRPNVSAAAASVSPARATVVDQPHDHRRLRPQLRSGPRDPFEAVVAPQAELVRMAERRLLSRGRCIRGCRRSRSRPRRGRGREAAQSERHQHEQRAPSRGTDSGNHVWVSGATVTGRQTYAREGGAGRRASDAAPGRPNARSVGLLVVVVFVLAVALRLPGFSDRVFNSDEAYLATQAQVLNHGGRLYVDTVDRKPPLVPYVYAAVFRVTGTDDLAAVRVIAVFAQVATALLLALEARRRFTWRHAALAAGVLFLLASSAFPPADAQAANFEIFMLPLMTLAFVLAVRERPVGAGVSLAVATLAKQTAALALVPLAYVAWRDRRGRGLLLLGVSFVAPGGHRRRRAGPARLRPLGVHEQRRLRRRERRHWIRLLERARPHRLVHVRERGARRALAVGLATSPPGPRPLALAPLRGRCGAHRLPLLPPLLPAAPAAARAAGDAWARLARRRATAARGPCRRGPGSGDDPLVRRPRVHERRQPRHEGRARCGDVRAHAHGAGCACTRVGPGSRGVLELGAPPGDPLRDDRVRHRCLGWSTTEPGRDAVRGARRCRSLLPGSRRDAARPHRRHVDRRPAPLALRSTQPVPSLRGVLAPWRLAPRRRVSTVSRSSARPVRPPERDHAEVSQTPRQRWWPSPVRRVVHRSGGVAAARELRRNRELADRCLSHPAGSSVLRQLHARRVPCRRGAVRCRLRPRGPHSREPARCRSEWGEHDRRTPDARRSRTRSAQLRRPPGR